MRHVPVLVTALAVASFATARLGAQAPSPCDPTAASYVCLGAQQGPEDLVVLPGAEWVVASSMSGDGGLTLIRVGDRLVVKAYPAATARNALATDYSACSGPPAADAFTTHGLYLAPGSGGIHRLLVVGHGAREAVEFFEIDGRGATPRLTWVGCVVAPDPIGLNSVRGLPDGGFVTTNFRPRTAEREATQRMLAGERNGQLWEWHPGGTWQQVPASDAAGANGVELSADGRTIYMATWGAQSVVRLSRGSEPPVRDEVALGFRVDNLHWANDGSLLAVGQGTGADAQHWLAVKVDPDTLAVSEVVKRADAAEFGAGTAAVELGAELWVGSFRGDRIAILPAPQ